jgi:DNA-binding IclR family transcriptional regulator
MLQTIEKASDVLALFDRDHTEWGVREVAETLGLAKSSAHDLLISLAQVGLLGKTEAGRYRLGWRLVTLSETLLATTELRREARPIMEELAAQYQETLHLAILDDTKVVYVDKLEGRQAVRVELTSLGTRLYAHCSALGKVLLAHRPEAEVKRIVQVEGLARFTPNTITHEVELDNAVIGDHAARGVTFGIHLCRGNNQSKFYASGGYDPIADVFRRTRFQRFLLEYDDERSGSFEPLQHVPDDRLVVLGLVTTKKPALEKKDDLKRRIEAAARFVPLERLALSPQCGFASTEEGNLVSPADQEAKLRLVAETAREVWGTA